MNREFRLIGLGASLVNAMGAVYASASSCADVGLVMAEDLTGEQHYAAPQPWMTRVASM